MGSTISVLLVIVLLFVVAVVSFVIGAAAGIFGYMLFTKNRDKKANEANESQSNINESL